MAEWLKAHAWKACIPQGIQSSNLCLSAIPFTYPLIISYLDHNIPTITTYVVSINLGKIALLGSFRSFRVTFGYHGYHGFEAFRHGTGLLNYAFMVSNSEERREFPARPY